MDTGVQESPAPHSSKKSEAQPGLLNKISDHVNHGIGEFFENLGGHIARRPKQTIIGCLLLTGLFSIGLVRFRVEANPEKLYVPQDSQSIKDRKVIEPIWGFRPLVGSVFIAPKSSGTNIFTDAGIDRLCSAISIVETLKVSHDGGTITWQDVCLKQGGQCMINSPANAWSGNCLAMKADASRGQTAKTNLAQIREYVGGVSQSSTEVTAVEAFAIELFFKNDEEEVAGMENHDPAVRAFDLKLSDELRKASNQGGIRILPYFAWAETTEQDGAIDNDVGLLSIGYVLLFLYTMTVMGKIDKRFVQTRVSLAIAAITAVIMALGACFGLCSAVGIPFQLVVSTLAFVLLGIGVDDSFVLTAAMDQIEAETEGKLPIDQLVARTLRLAGSSIAVTSVTDVVAFLAGASSSLPALSGFCWYAGVGLFFDFFFQITFFVACMTLDAQRQRENRLDCLVCMRATSDGNNPSEGEGSPKATSSGIIHTIVGVWIPKVALHPVGKIVSIGIATFLFAGSIYGSTRLSFNFDIRWFTPDNSFLQDAYEVQDKYFEGNQIPASIYLSADSNQQWFQGRSLMAALYTSASESAVTSGQLNDPIHTFEQTSEAQSAANADEWVSRLKSFADSNPGAGSLLKFSGDRLTQARLRGFTRVEGQSPDRVEDMDTFRQFCEPLNNDSNAPSCIAYSFVYMFWEGDKAIVWETVRNIIIASSVVFCVCLVLLAHAGAAMLVFACLVAIDIDLLGFMYFVGLDFNSVTTINLVIALGLAVDYSAHIAHAFLHAQGTRTERSAIALKNLGPSVANGGISTFLAVLMMAGAQSFIFRTFFRMFAMIVSLGLFHGLVVLPVLLSWMGPAAISEHKFVNGQHDKKPEPSGDSSVQQNAVVVDISPRKIAVA